MQIRRFLALLVSVLAMSSAASTRVSAEAADIPATSALPSLPPVTAPDFASEGIAPQAVVLSADGSIAFVAQNHAKSVAQVELATGKILATRPVPAAPNSIALSADGKSVFVACGLAEGVVRILTSATLADDGSITVGHTPSAIAVTRDGNTLFVANRFDDEIGVVDLGQKMQVARIRVAREPIAIALSKDEKSLVVANHLPASAADGDFIAAKISLINTATRKVTAEILLPNGSSSMRGLCVSPDGAFAYATHILSRYQMPTTQVDRGWINTNALTIVDMNAGKRLATILLDDPERGAANPTGVACSPDGSHIMVACAGVHEITVIKRAALHAKINAHLTNAETAARPTQPGNPATAAAYTPAAVTQIHDDTAFLVGLRERVPLSGVGPRGLASAGSKAVCANFFSDSLGVVDFSTGKAICSDIPLGPPPKWSPERHGEMLFNDARPCLQQWQSCASCHPDGRADGLNWDLLNDGIGNPKNTRSLLRAFTGHPVMALGVRSHAGLGVRAGFKFIQFAARPESDALAIDAYLRAMPPVPGPHTRPNSADHLKRGKQLFTTLNCTHCHLPPYFNNTKLYDMETGRGVDKNKPFTVPKLTEVWRTAPYLHDGRATSLHDLFDKHQHGITNQKLPDRDLTDLVDYIKSL